MKSCLTEPLIKKTFIIRKVRISNIGLSAGIRGDKQSFMGPNSGRVEKGHIPPKTYIFKGSLLAMSSIYDGLTST
jgi:hypothetical protein